MTVYRIGRLGFSIVGTHPVADELRAEFAPVRSEGDTALRFQFVPTLEPLHGATHIMPLRIGSDRFAAEHSGFEYQVGRHADVIEADVRPLPPGPFQRALPDTLLRVLDWNYLTAHETAAKNFMYNIFDYLSQVAQLRLDQSYLHASSFERDGHGVAIIAWGGIGKTTAMLKLVLEDGWRFLSDDLVTIDTGGMLWRSPKRLQIYGYNTDGQERIRKVLLDSRTLLDRGAWALRRKLRGPRLVRRRVAAEALFGHAGVASSARLTHAIFIERADTDRFAACFVSPAELARRAASTLLRELQPFSDLSVAMYAGDRHPVLPTVQSLYDASLHVLEQALAHVQPLAVSLPLAAGPDEVSSFIRTVLNNPNAPAS